MRKITSIAAIVAALSWQPAATMAAEKETEVQYTSLPATALWRLIYSPESCNLIRTFGTGDDALTVNMKWANPGSDRFDIQLTGSHHLLPKPGSEFSYQFLPNGREIALEEVFYGTGMIGGEQAVTIWLGSTNFNGEFPPSADDNDRSGGKRPGQEDSRNGSTGQLTAASVDAENAKTGMRVQALAFALTGYGPYRLELGSMEKPMRAVRNCLDDLLAGWGLDAEVMENLRSPPTPLGNPGKWVMPDEYPSDALRNEQSAVVAFRLMIDSEGKASDCIVANINYDEEFAKITCKLLSRRARFAPAIDADGNPTPSYFVSSVRWAVPQW